MPGRKQTTPEQDARIEQLHMEGNNASQIHRRLETEELLTHPHPNVTLRLVQDRVRKMAPPDSSGLWTFASAPPGEARLVGDVFAYIADVSGFRIWLTRDLARYVARVRDASPHVPAPWAYALARMLRTLETQPEPQDMRGVDLVLSARPWESPERAVWCNALMFAFEQQYGDWLRSLFATVRLLSDAKPGGMVGSIGNPWPETSTPKLPQNP